MTISTITLAGKQINLVAMPETPGLRAVEFTAYDGVGAVPAPFVGKVQTQRWHGGDMWSGKATLPSMMQPNADNWLGFFEEMRGMLNAFQMGDPLQPVNRGSGAGAPVVDNTANGGNPAGSDFVATKGWTPNAVGVMLVGDYMQLGFRLYKALEQVDADADGNALIPIWPSLRETPANDGTSKYFINANGHCEVTISKSLGNTNYGVIWQDFSIPPNATLPADAVIQGIYPVLICRANHDGANSYYESGTGLRLDSPGSNFAEPFDPSSLTFSSTEFYGSSIGTDLSDLDGQEIMAQLNQSLFLTLTDTIDIAAVGYAVYYTTATPPTGPDQMPAPFAVPDGQAVAWALPFDVTQTGVQTGGSGIFDPGTGEGVGVPVTDNGGLVLNGAKGLFRLATNKRDWSVDKQRVTDITFPFQEYR